MYLYRFNISTWCTENKQLWIFFCLCFSVEHHCTHTPTAFPNHSAQPEVISSCCQKTTVRSHFSGKQENISFETQPFQLIYGS